MVKSAAKSVAQQAAPGKVAACICVWAGVGGLWLGAALFTGCSGHPSDQQIQQQAAQTTQQVKQEAEEAAGRAKVTAAHAEEKINAIAAGVKEGLQSGPAGQAVDLNSASRDQLVALPGITPAKARRIIGGRPYMAPRELVSKGVLTRSEFNQISARVKVR